VLLMQRVSDVLMECAPKNWLWLGALPGWYC